MIEDLMSKLAVISCQTSSDDGSFHERRRKVCY